MADAKGDKLKAKLTAQMARFCELLVADKESNQYKAYENAGYKARGAAARVNASKLLTRPNIAAYIQHLRDERSKRTNIDADKVLKEYELLGFSDIRNYFDIDENTGELILKSFDNMPPKVSRAIESIQQDRIIKESADGKQVVVHDKVKIKLWSKPQALEMIAKYLGMFKDKGETPATPITNNINVGIDFGKYSNDQIRKGLGRLVTASVETGGNRITGE